MARIKTIQASFSNGEVSDGFEGRIDLEGYAKSARKLRNCYIDNIGFAFRREGMQYIDAVESNVKPRLLPFAFNTEQTYLFEFTPGKLRVFEDDVEIDDITSSPIDTLTAAQIDEMDFVQSADTMILVHEDVEPIRITRTGATTFTADNLPLTNIPQHNFPDTVGAGVDEIQRLSLNFSAGTGSFIMTLEGEETGGIDVANGAGPANAVIIRDALRALNRTSATGITVVDSGGGAFYDITYGGGDGDRDWETPKITSTFGLNVATIKATTEGSEPLEDVWSATRGWPRSVTFFEGRLWFGGSKSRPQTIWGSTVFDFFSFSVGSGQDDEALDLTIDDNEINAINSIFAGRTLQVFTTGGEFAFIKDVDAPITPKNTVIRKQTLHGSKQLRPVSIDGGTIFVEGSGNVLREFVFNDLEQSFTAPNISLLSDDVVEGITRLVVRKSTNEQPVSYVYMVKEDGTIGVLNKLREQNLRAYSQFETTGTVEDIAVVGDEVYLAVERNIGGSDIRQIEKLNPDFFMDSSHADTDVTAKTLWTGFTEIADQDVTVLGRIEPGQLYGSLVDNNVDVSGEITTEIEIKEIEVGLFFAAEIETLPIEAILGQSQTAGEWKRLVAANIRMLNSRNLLIIAGRSTYRPNFRQFDTELLDEPIPLFDGWKKVYIGGVDRDVTVTITQEEPFEFKVLLLAIDVAL